MTNFYKLNLFNKKSHSNKINKKAAISLIKMKPLINSIQVKIYVFNNCQILNNNNVL